MSDNDLVRPSRDGDQFHYLRAARLCLGLLGPGSELATVTIEGVPSGEDIEAGLDVIDLGLYFGSADLTKAGRVHYRQFKHSTRNAQTEWTASGLEKTLGGFARRYTELVNRFGRADVAARFCFEFETNRAIGSSVHQALIDLAQNRLTKTSAYFREKLDKHGLTGNDLASFASLIRLLPGSGDYLTQRRALEQDFGAYLPDNDKDAPLKLKELVTRKATSEFAHDPSIRREDVLHAIGVDQRDLFPAPSLIETPDPVVRRTQMFELAAGIIAADSPVLLYADGGVGKSVAAALIGTLLPAGSATFLYDCFGNGGYRSPSEYRHRPRDGLTQLANEMAAAGLCDPLVPTNNADAAAFVRAFKARLRQASAIVAADSPEALLTIIIDAADNAQMAAEEAQDGPSFARLLIRENFPGNVRIVMTARPHRLPLLNPPPEARRLELLPFDEDESEAHLHGRFPQASAQDVREFHRLTSRNPRVQRVALDGGDTVSAVLAELGPKPKSVSDTIGDLLERAIARVRDSAASLEQPQVDRLCTALATLRPFVPIDVVAATADVPAELVRSIANDLGRPLLVREDAVQFRDEPTETWFRDRFRPGAADLGAFVSRLRPLARKSAYVAATLPQMMLEAGEFDALMTLALSSDDLPTDNAIVRRDIELQRLQFSLKAALRAKKYSEAAKLALKAGGEAAADTRQQTMLSANTDLAARFVDADRLVDQVSRRLISGGAWTGSEHAYEAALLSGNPALGGDARSRLRIAYDWVEHWNRRLKADPEHAERMADADIAELQMAELNLHGPEACARQIRRWRPREISFRVGRILLARLVDAGRFEEIDALGVAAGNDLGLLLAVILELHAVGRVPPRAAVGRALALACSRHVRIEAPDGWRGEETRLEAIDALVRAAIAHRQGSKRRLARLLRRYLPKHAPRSIASEYAREERAVYLRAYTLRAALQGVELTPEALAAPELRKAVRAKADHHPDARRLREDIGALLPWHKLAVEVQMRRGNHDDLGPALEAAQEASRAAERQSFRERSSTADEIALIWCELVLGSRDPNALWPSFQVWLDKLKQPLFVPTLVSLARRAARTTDQEARALGFAEQAFRLVEGEKQSADEKAESYVALARAVLTASEAESEQYFDEAVIVSSRIGEENLGRWTALTQLAEAAANDGRDDPELAYRFARGAELTYSYVVRDKHFDWENAVEATVGLSARSGPAILSRWNDRRFGREARLLPTLATELVRRNAIDPRDALPLVCFRVDWDYALMLETALEAAASAEERRTIVDWAFRYLPFVSPSAKTWRAIQLALERHKLAREDLPSMVERAERAEAASVARERTTYPRAKDAAPDWQRILDGVDFFSATDLGIALDRYMSTSRGYDREPFLRQIFARVPAGRESAVLDAYEAAFAPDLYDLRALLDALPESWSKRRSVKPRLAQLARKAYRRCAASVSAYRYYQLLPLELVTRTTDLTKADLFAEVVDAIGSTSLPVGAGGLFQLVGLLASLLRAGEAASVLRYGLDLLDPALEPTDGDGPWTSELEPPTDARSSIAGYLWAALGSTQAGRRWEAAHAVRTSCYLGRDQLITALINFARRGDGGAFTDRSLRFYDLHARQWLLIALARAALDRGDAVAPHTDFLRLHGTRSNPHVVMRGFAADALLSLADQEKIELSKEELEQLRTLNASSLAPVKNKEERRSPRKARKQSKDPDRFLLGHDFTKNWIGPLARSFSLSDEAIETAVAEIISKDWGLDDNGHWDSDERGVRGFFRNDWSRDDGTASRNDTLSTYLSYHALMTVAGKLLETKPVRHGADDWRSFDSWILGQGLTRSDGFWLFDRRDPAPPDADILPAPEEGAAIHISQALLLSILHTQQGEVVVWGSWAGSVGRRRHQASVHSALVGSERLGALARALAATKDPYLYRIPDHGDDLEIDEHGYVLKGWICEAGSEPGLDERDSWAGDVGTRPLAPALPIARLLGAKSDLLGRCWRDAEGQVELRSEIWNDGRTDEDGSSSGGKRLVASRAWLDRLMDTMGMGMIFEVEVEDRPKGERYERENRGRRADSAKATGIFVLEHHGKLRQVQSRARARGEAGR